MPLEQPVPFGHDRLEARVAIRRETATGPHDQLEPPLVVTVDRLRELARLARVDQHRDVQPGTHLPDRVKLEVVYRHPPPLGVTHCQTEVLEQLQPDGTCCHVPFELGRRPVAKAGRHTVAEVQVGKDDHPTRMRALADRLHPAGKCRAVSPAQVHEHLEVQLVHFADNGAPPLTREPGTVVAVDIHDRKLRARHRVLGHHQGGPRRVLLDRQ